MNKSKFFKKTISIIILTGLVFSFLFCYDSNADVSEKDCLELFIEDFTIKASSPANFSVQIVSNPGIASLKLRFNLSNDFWIPKVTFTDILPLVEPEYNLEWFSENDVYETGELMDVFIKELDMKKGVYPVTMDVVYCKNSKGEDVPVKINTASATIVYTLYPDKLCLYEDQKPGKIDVLANREGILHCNPLTHNDNKNLGDMLTDGLITIDKRASDYDEAFSLSDFVFNRSNDYRLKFPNVPDRTFIYGVTFDNLPGVTVDSFDLYFSPQSPSGTASGASENSLDKRMTILVSFDNGNNYQIAYEYTGQCFYDDVIERVQIIEGVTFVYDYAVAHIDLNAPLIGVTNIAYASDSLSFTFLRAGGLSEISAYKSDDSQSYPSPTPMKTPVVTEKALATQNAFVTPLPTPLVTSKFTTVPSELPTPSESAVPTHSSAAATPELIPLSTLTDTPAPAHSPTPVESCMHTSMPEKRMEENSEKEKSGKNYIWIIPSAIILAFAATAVYLLLKKKSNS